MTEFVSDWVGGWVMLLALILSWQLVRKLLD